MRLRDPLEDSRRVRVIVQQDDKPSRSGSGRCSRASKSLTVYDAGRDEVFALIEESVRKQATTGESIAAQ